MKTPDKETVSQLTDLPNIGKASAGDLHLIGINHPQDLIGQNAFDMYEKLCTLTGKKHDPCMIDVFMSAVHFMETGEALHWYSFTLNRKEKMNQQQKG